MVRSRGFDAFSYADLSRDVGIRKASIHHHFPAKSDLSLALVKRYTQNFLVSLPDTGPAAKQLECYLDLYRAALRGGDCVCLCVAFSAGRDSLTEPVIEALNAFHRDSANWLRRVFSEGRNDGTISNGTDDLSEAISCLALVEGAQLVARAAKDVDLFDAAIAPLRSRLQ